MNLPLKPSPPSARNPELLLLYGLPLCGKTTFATQLPEPYIILDLDGHCKYLTCCHVTAPTFMDVWKFCDAVVAAKKPYKYVVVDSLSSLIAIAEKFSTDSYNSTKKPDQPAVQSIYDLSAGRGFTFLYAKFNILIDRLKTIAPHIIFIGHCKDKWDGETSVQMNMETMKGEKRNILEEPTEKILDLPGKLATNFLSQMHAVGYFRKGGKIVFEGTADRFGARVAHLNGMTVDADWKNIYLQ